MAKKKDKKEEEEPVQKTKNVKETPVEKFTLVELVNSCPVEDSWIIYNLGRVGLLEQYEQESKDYGIKEIKPTFTIEEFEKIINGVQ